MIALLYTLLLIFGLIFLWWSGERTIKYTKEISRIYKLGSFFIGFVLLAISTGIPELGIAIQSIWNSTPILSVGDILGSNFLNISVVLGLPTTMLGAIFISKENYKNILLMLIINILLMSSIFISQTLTRLHGICFIILYFASCRYLWKVQKQEQLTTNLDAKSDENISNETSKLEQFIVFLNLFFCLACILISSKICVHAAINLVKQTSISIEILGATILALGTSLPEITLNLAAIKRKDYALAIGNALGSVLENASLIIGILAIFSKEPINVSSMKWIAPFFYAACIVIGFGIFFRKKINFLEGALLLILTLVFFIYGYSAQLF